MKKKIFAIVLCICMLAIAIVGGTMAYFTDEAAQTNTFTAVKVGINLDEAVVKQDTETDSETYGDLIADGEKRTSEAQTYHLFPAMKVTKDPTITVDADSENAYVAAVVTVSGDLYSLIGVADSNNLDITKLVSGGEVQKPSQQVTGWNGLSMVYETADCVIYQDASQGSQTARGTWTMYVFVKAPKAAGSSVTLFDTMTIPEKWNNTEMAKINNMSIAVNAYATQTNGFVDCFTAMTTAFPEAFDFT